MFRLSDYMGKVFEEICRQQDKNTALFGECKWTNEKVDLSVLETLVKRSELFRIGNIGQSFFAIRCHHFQFVTICNQLIPFYVLVDFSKLSNNYLRHG